MEVKQKKNHFSVVFCQLISFVIHEPESFQRVKVNKYINMETHHHHHLGTFSLSRHENLQKFLRNGEWEKI
jgi:hypothetical protein